MEKISQLSKHGEKNSQRRSFRYTDRELFDLMQMKSMSVGVIVLFHFRILEG